MRIGVLGGTFNPIHYGHLRAAEDVRQKAGLDRVLFVPTGNPPLKSDDLATAEQRYAMVQMAISTNPGFGILDMELKRQAKSYSVQTAEELGRLYPDDERFFITGIDAFLDLPKWKSPDRLIGLIGFLLINRPPHRFIDLGASPYFQEGDLGMLESMDRGEMATATMRLSTGAMATLISVSPVDLSSTRIRAAVQGRRSIKYLLPENVESFIITNGLYVG